MLERTPDGHPDFQGVWANNTVTPLQRPKQWEGKQRLTDAEIVQSPGYVTILSEMAHDARIIPLDGRPHLDSRFQRWNGDSRAHWDGDTLVIDTTNFSPKSDFMGSHENLRLTEKITCAGPEILNYEFTINDPTTWTAPWTAMIPLRLKNEAIFEFACHEGNEAIPDMLLGHRFEEREAERKTRSK